MFQKCLSHSIIASAFVLVTAALAQSPLPSAVPPDWNAVPHPGDGSPLETIAAENPDCAEFSNACVVCIRTSADTLGCSNIGIACQPEVPWRCTKRGASTLAPK